MQRGTSPAQDGNPASRLRLIPGRARPARPDVRVVAFSAIAMTMTIYGQTPGISVLVDPAAAELGLGRAEVSIAYSAGSLVAGIALPWVGRRLDSHGVRDVTLAISVLFGVAILVLASAQSLLWLGLGFFGVRLLGQGALSLAARTAVALHFDVHLGRAVAVTGSLAAIGMSLIPLALAALIATAGWRLTWGLGAVSVWLIVLPAAALLLRPRSAGLRARTLDPTASDWTAARAMRTPMFWMITLASGSVAMIMTGFAFHQISVLGEAGLSPAAAAANFLPQTVASVAVLSIVAPLAGRWSSRRLLASSMVPLGVALLAVPVLQLPLAPLVYALGFGAALGAIQVLDGILYPRHFGVAAIGSIRSVAFTVTVVAAAAGPVIVAIAHEISGGYAAVALVLAVLPLGLGLAALAVREPGPAPVAAHR